jgi:hypothetical protein
MDSGGDVEIDDKARKGINWRRFFTWKHDRQIVPEFDSCPEEAAVT